MISHSTFFLPTELWKQIFCEFLWSSPACFCCRTNCPVCGEYFKIELISTTCRSLVIQLVREYFFEEKAASNKMLNYFSDATALDLGCNEEIADSCLKNLTNLTTLNLLNNEKIGRSLIRLTKMQSLNLTNNPCIVDADIALMSNLRELRLERNLLINCVSTFGQLAILDLSENSIITNESLLQLPNLTHLSLCRNAVITGETLVQLTKLVKLNLSDNPMIQDGDLERISNLKHLSLSHNTIITDLGIGHLDLESFNLHGNSNITNQALQKLTSLGQLILSHNKIITTDTLAGMSNLKSLVLWGSSSNITSDCLLYLTNLTYLDLYGNSSIVGSSMVNLTNLTKLDISNTNMNLKDLPTLGSLTELYNWRNSFDPADYYSHNFFSKFPTMANFCCWCPCQNGWFDIQ